MDVSPAKRSYFTCANVWWKLLFHSTIFCELLIEKVNATLRSLGVRTFSWTKLLFLNYVYIEMDSFHLTIF